MLGFFYLILLSILLVFSFFMLFYNAFKIADLIMPWIISLITRMCMIISGQAEWYLQIQFEFWV
jgi:hypothetical protein